MGERRGIPILLAVLMLTAGCTSDANGARLSEAEARDPADEAVQVVQEYLDALRTGDVEAALQYRCSDVGDLPIELTEENLERLTGLVGQVEAVEVREIDQPATLATELPDPVIVGYRLVIDGEPHPRMEAVTVDEDGERRWCGRATTLTDQLFSEQHDELLVAQPASTSGVLSDLMPSTGPPGEELQPDEASVPTSAFERPQPGQRASWTRGWEKPGYGGSRVSAIEFETEQHAVDAARLALRLKFHDGIETFSIEGAPGAIGIRVLELAWLDVQPPDVGPYIDWVYIVYGTTVVEATVSELFDDPNHDAVAGLVRQVHELAAPDRG